VHDGAVLELDNTLSLWL